jgi:hypothetical protein
MKTIKPLLIIASALFLFLTLNSYSCKKIKKGTLEVKITETISSTSTYYKAISVSNDNDKYYAANTEFNLESENNYTVITGYFWPDKSPQALGYTRHDGDAESGYGKKYKYDTNAQGFTNKEDDNYSGKNGHWPSASSSSGSGSSSGSSTTSQYEGIWKRSDGADAYLKLAGTSAKVCNGGSVTNGTFNSSVPSATFTVSGQTHVFTFSIRNGLLIMDVPPTSTNPNHIETEYVKTTAWPC